MRFAIVIAVAAIGCNGKAQTVDDQPTPQPKSGSAADAGGPAPTWTLETAPVDVDCGGAALDVEKPEATKPTGDRRLQPSSGIVACHGLANIAAVCNCLATSAGKWAADSITPPAACAVETIDGLTDPRAAIVEVSTNPSETATKVGGREVVLVVQQGSTWSAVDSVEGQPDVDLAVTPKRSGMVKIDRVDVEPGLVGMLYVFQSRSWTSEHDVGQTDSDGTAQVTICSLPNASGARAFCYLPLQLAEWSYTHDDSKDKCTVHTGDMFVATISATSAILRLVHGRDEHGMVGRYVF